MTAPLLATPSLFAWLSLPLVLPLCFFVAWSDMRAMRIPNKSVLLLVAIYAVLGLIALPFETYLWGYAALVVALLCGIVLNMIGLIGAGDAKFAAAAIPFVHSSDYGFVMVLFAANAAAAFLTHRLTRLTPMAALAPDWASWERLKEFPMGLSLGGTLALFLIQAALLGS